jgi:hypothetical protein
MELPTFTPILKQTTFVHQGHKHLITNDLELFSLLTITKTNRMENLNFRIVFSAVVLALLTFVGCQIRPIDDINLFRIRMGRAID